MHCGLLNTTIYHLSLGGRVVEGGHPFDATVTPLFFQSKENTSDEAIKFKVGKLGAGGGCSLFLSITAMTLAFLMVERRWAMVITLRP